MADPKPFNLNEPADMARWFREMDGYLDACDFANQGTDLQGRKFALEGFRRLREILVYDRASRRACPHCDGLMDIAELSVDPGKDVTVGFICQNCGRSVLEVHTHSFSESEDKILEEEA